MFLTNHRVAYKDFKCKQTVLLAPYLNSTTMEGQHVKKRRPNFADEEVFAMWSAVQLHKSVILGKLDSRVTSKAKSCAWIEVTRQVNMVGRVMRDVAEVRKRFSDFRAIVKKKAASQKKHCGATGW